MCQLHENITWHMSLGQTHSENMASAAAKHPVKSVKISGQFLHIDNSARAGNTIGCIEEPSGTGVWPGGCVLPF